MTSPTSLGRPLVFVDDEPLILESFGQLLRSHLSCPVHTFSSPLQALERLADLNPGVIITDYSMPGMNGLKFLTHAQQILPETNFVILTGEAIEFDAAELRVLPSLKGILRKPLHWRDLAAYIVGHWPEESAPVLQETALAS